MILRIKFEAKHYELRKIKLSNLQKTILSRFTNRIFHYYYCVREIMVDETSEIRK
jgi:hypothetical protein